MVALGLPRHHSQGADPHEKALRANSGLDIGPAQRRLPNHAVYY